MSSTPKVVQLHPPSISTPTNAGPATAQNEVLPGANRPLQRRSGATVDIAAALHENTTALMESLAGAGQMKLRQGKTSGYFVDVACAGPLVVLVNEAVQNAIKYAHPSGVSGTIVMDFRQEDDGAIVIEVVDDGVGLPEGFDPAVDGEIGLRLIRRQAEACGGSVSFESSCLGLSVSVRVPPQFASQDPGPNGDGILDDTQQSRSILEALPSAIYTTDAAGRITFFNESAATLWGVRPELGKSEFCGSWKLYWPDGTPMLHDECPMAQTLKTGKPVRGATAVAERPDGTRVSFIPYPTPLFDDAGTLIGGVNMLVDITETNRTDFAQQRLAAIIELSDDAIISKDLTGTITTWNSGAERLFGYTAAEAIGNPVTMLIPDNQVNDEPKIIASIQRGEKIDHYETVRRRKDGTLIDISLTVSPIKNAQGKIIGASKIARDITQQRRAQEQQNLILNEIKHRIRNTLATVQAISAQTMRSATAEERSAFAARLRTLAAAHDLLTLEKWNQASLSEVVGKALDPFVEEHRARFDSYGPNLSLNANNALLVAMALHELATNAVKYGSLSNKRGSVQIAWNVLPGNADRMRLTWREAGGPAVTPPSRKGFGSLLIEMAFQDRGGSSRIDFDPQGLVCTLELDL